MRTTYILDTSVLIQDPYAYKSFPHSDIIIPIAVLNELDKLKKQSNEAGKNARVAIRTLDELSAKGDISTGVLTEEDVLIKIDATYYDLKGPEFAGFGDPSYGDTQILACAIQYLSDDLNKDVIFVSNDINLRVKAKSRALPAVSHENHKYSLGDLYNGTKVVRSEEAGLDLQKFGYIDHSLYGINLSPNQCVSFEDDDGNVIALGRCISENKLKLIKKHYPWNVSPRNKEQSFAMDLIMDKSLDLITLVGRAGSGKTLVTLASALELVLSKKEYDKFIIYRPIQEVGNGIGYLPGPQPLGSKIVTPDGWTTMGQLKSGDYVIARDGTPSKVLQTFPKGKKEVFRITTTDGTTTEACGDHPWMVKTSRNATDYKIVTTNQIKESLHSTNYYLPRNNAVQFSKKELPIPPYSLGVYLGDGSSSDNHFTIYSNDNEIVEKVQSELINFDVYMKHQKANKLSYRFYSNKQFGRLGSHYVLATNINDNSTIEFESISRAGKYFNINPQAISRLCSKEKIKNGYRFKYLDKTMNSSHPIISQIKNLRLNGKRAWEKNIPDIYKYSSIEDRIELLRGLMDTDGSIKKNGECSFTTTSKQLAEDMVELVRSLGGRATVRSRNRIGKSNKTRSITITAKRLSYEFTISMPSDINPFYLTRKSERFNEKKSIASIGIKSIESVGEKEVQCILIDNPEHLYLTDNFIVTHNTMEEKLAPWFQAIMDNFEGLFSTKGHTDWRKNLEMYQRKGLIEMEAITFIRGRSIPNSIILVDEAQNLSKEDVKTIITRAGEGTKIILTGDIEQIDNSALDATNNGLTHVIEKFKESGIAGHITFTKCERSRLASIAADIL